MLNVLEIEFGLVIGKDEIPITKNQLKLNKDTNLELALTEILGLISDDYVTNTYYLDIYNKDEKLDMCFIILNKNNDFVIDLIYSNRPDLNFLKIMIEKILMEEPLLI